MASMQMDSPALFYTLLIQEDLVKQLNIVAHKHFFYRVIHNIFLKHIYIFTINLLALMSCSCSFSSKSSLRLFS